MDMYYRFDASTPYSGTTIEHFVKFESVPSKEELDDMAWEYAQEVGAEFEYLVTGWGCDEPEDEQEAEYLEVEIDCYYSDCHCEYEEITEAEYYEESGE
jgi:hypothetical protein